MVVVGVFLSESNYIFSLSAKSATYSSREESNRTNTFRKVMRKCKSPNFFKPLTLVLEFLMALVFFHKQGLASLHCCGNARRPKPTHIVYENSCSCLVPTEPDAQVL